jgi:hypothetical protein
VTKNSQIPAEYLIQTAQSVITCHTNWLSWRMTLCTAEQNSFQIRTLIQEQWRCHSSPLRKQHNAINSNSKKTIHKAKHFLIIVGYKIPAVGHCQIVNQDKRLGYPCARDCTMECSTTNTNRDQRELRTRKEGKTIKNELWFYFFNQCTCASVICNNCTKRNTNPPQIKIISQ